ncbi:PEP/pyruvate-binding domain-containing protein, partial [Gemmatimonadota bacterium]
MSVRRLDELRRGQAQEFGGKAANLGELTACGVEVPPGFAISISGYLAHADRCGLRAALGSLIAEERWQEVEQAAAGILSSVPVDPELASAIVGAFRCLGAPLVAVRSSATGEDAAATSFAGQYRTHLNLSGEEALIEGVRSCWSSLWGRRAVEYRQRWSLDHFAQGMG